MSPYQYWYNERLTGETRYRTSLFGKLVLQVKEVRRLGDDGDHNCFRSPYDGEDFVRWRDAKTQDLNELLRKENNND